MCKWAVVKHFGILPPTILQIQKIGEVAVHNGQGWKWNFECLLAFGSFVKDKDL